MSGWETPDLISRSLAKTLTISLTGYSQVHPDEHEERRVGSSPSRVFGRLELLPDEEVLIDDRDAAIVMVFPKGTPHGGTVDPEERIDNPLEKCGHIFDRGGGALDHNWQGHLTEEYGTNAFADLRGKKSVSAGLYHQVVRTKLLDILEDLGIHVSAFDSIDGDEVFLKLSLPRDGSVIKHLAQRYQYKMPFLLHLRHAMVTGKNTSPQQRRAQKQAASATSSLKGLDHYNREVNTFTEFEFELADKLQPFRQVDEIRLVQLCLMDNMNVAELKAQNVISAVFPAANYQAVTQLSKHFGSRQLIYKIWKVPDLVTLETEPDSKYYVGDQVRDYFGEEVAFFFHWLMFYIWMLVPLGLVGLICWLRHLLASVTVQRRIQLGFSFVLIAWATCFDDLFKRRTARCKQRWGMKDFETITIERAEYDESTEGTFQNEIVRHMTSLFVGVYCILFIGLVGVVEFHKSEAMIHHKAWASTFGPMITVGLIQGSSVLWNRIAPILANLQNHRTDQRWNNALTVILCAPKLLLAMYPFFHTAFIKKFSYRTCIPRADGGSALHPHGNHSWTSSFKFDHLANLSWELYWKRGWPEGIPNRTELSELTGPEGITSAFDLSWLQGYAYRGSANYCVWGCFPQHCVEESHTGWFDLYQSDITSRWACVTNCASELESNLFVFFFTGIVTQFVFLCIPVILTKYEINKEILQARGSVRERSELNGNGDRSTQLSKNGDGGTEKVYTFMQFQAKCHEAARYEYYSWGGSIVEDYLECARGFALMTCFGIALPAMSFIALLGSIVQFRLLAFRMTHLTCRPWPAGADGIGMWEDIFGLLSFVAVVTNIGLAVFVMHPMQMWRIEHQLAAFLILEHAMLLLREILRACIPDEPDDVRRIEGFNSYFIHKLVKHKDYEIPPEESSRTKNVDLGICKWR